MKNYIFRILSGILLISLISAKAQDITFVPQDTLIIGTLGTEMVFDIDVTNISPQNQTVYMVRTLNDLPPDWTSSLCFESCVHPSVDSLASATPFAPNESRIVSVHVFAANNPGTAHVQIKAGTFRSPAITYTVNLTVIVDPTSVNSETKVVNNFSLSQNYPNPFNPTTKIKYNIPLDDSPLLGAAKGRFVTMKIYDVLGNEVATLVNEEQSPGTYEVEFSTRGRQESGSRYLVSGIYFYRLTAGSFTQTRKMILEK